MRVFIEIAFSDFDLILILFVQADVYKFKCYVFYLKTMMLQIL